MSNKEQLDTEFKDAVGMPANEHAKKKNKEKNKKQKESKLFEKHFYTLKGVKILMITAKPNGAYSTYVGKIKKDKDGNTNKKTIDLQIEKWKKESVWINEHDLQEKIAGIVSELSEKYQAHLLKGHK